MGLIDAKSQIFLDNIRVKEKRLMKILKEKEIAGTILPHQQQYLIKLKAVFA